MIHVYVAQKLGIVRADLQANAARECRAFFVGGPNVEPQRCTIVEIASANFADKYGFDFNQVLRATLTVLFVIVSVRLNISESNTNIGKISCNLAEGKIPLNVKDN